MNRVAVFCGSSSGSVRAYGEGAKELGQALAEAGITLVYGGASVGLMGVVADTVLRHGGQVIGVIPKSLVDHELAHDNLTELHIVDSMHERKALMAELSEGFITMPGGSGTMEEFFEVFTWAQLGFHQKPCGLLNLNGYYTSLIQFFSHMVQEGFMKKEYPSMVLSDTKAKSLLEQMNRYQPPETFKWEEKRKSVLSQEKEVQKNN
ncbi:TIGR00730 family Rossman fold protein [Kroppenstedtia pulmonis]|uniref:Cytokinin riboside 5'-monophosphate phosphoribohydrolase n=1 Tax=Kroppenstedtia pulmonis TaxID=1380685 RepID=A0A7D4B1F0_9BACL|nr:TIGR00730 family Rossman fold protein [Kroppenstedtia pulmonis]QKG83546.1 TIGR00730 family Rossman fold protein [Kroppenstedtia pulmonis]